MGTPSSKGMWGVVKHSEPKNVEFLMTYANFYQHIKDCDWFMFLELQKGNNIKVTRTFVVNYDGKEDTVKNISFAVNEQNISDANGCPKEVENWFKGYTINLERYNQFLTEDHQSTDQSKGIPQNWIKSEFHDIVQFVQKYITCEGRFSITFLYRMRFLLHLYHEKKINLPFFWGRVYQRWH